VLRLAYSPCPNDTFIFHAWVRGLVAGAPAVEERLEDIDTLNGLAGEGLLDVVKLSFAAFAHVRGGYALLHSGGALGRGCGPIIVARKDSYLRAAPSVRRTAELADELARARVAIPGNLTTAALLAGLFIGGLKYPVVMPFHQIMPAVAGGEVDAGGLRRLVDLGEWWEDTTGLPIPLGGIAVSRHLERPLQDQVERAVLSSLEHARSHPEVAMQYVQEHSQEMDLDVCRAHIDLYVNEFSLDYGPDGEDAIRHLLQMAADTGVVADADRGLFWDD
jgi:1,4-dihydroxy-6-naphthoate synthase